MELDGRRQCNLYFVCNRFVNAVVNKPLFKLCECSSVCVTVEKLLLEIKNIVCTQTFAKIFERLVEPTPPQMKCLLSPGVSWRNFQDVFLCLFAFELSIRLQIASFPNSCVDFHPEKRKEPQLLFPRRLCAYGLRGFFNPYTSVRQCEDLVQFAGVLCSLM